MTGECILDNQQTILNASNKYFEGQCNLTTSLTQTVLTGWAKLIELHMNATQAALIESGAATKQYLSTDPKEWLSLTVAHSQPTAGKAFDYLRYASKIVSETQAELKQASEARIAEASGKIQTMVDALVNSGAAEFADTLVPLKVPTGKTSTKSGLAAAA